MDRIGLITLQAEVTDDVRAATEAATLAGQRLAQGGDSGLESCAYQLARTFNIIEQMGLRIAKAFENHIDDERGWHAELIHRLSITVPGVRPALCETEIIPALRDLRGFRHVVADAYDLAASRPFDDFDVNAVGTLNFLEATRQACPESTFVHMSTNKVYGDALNEIALAELDKRWDAADSAYRDGIRETFRIDQARRRSRRT